MENNKPILAYFNGTVANSSFSVLNVVNTKPSRGVERLEPEHFYLFLLCVGEYDVGDRTQIPQQTHGGERTALRNISSLPSLHGLQKSKSVLAG